MITDLELTKQLYDKPVFQRLLKRLAPLTGTEFGVLEAIVFGRAVDFFYRYSLFAKNIDAEGVTVDVGSGKIGIGVFIPEENTISLDVNPESVRSASGHRVIASAGDLPFRVGSVTTVVSGDCVEHLPKSVRASFIEDAKKAAKVVMVHTPNREYAQYTDSWLEETHQRLFGVGADMHVEHDLFGQPTVDEMGGYFGSSENWTVQGTQNWRVNYILFILQRIPLVGWFSGLLFLVLLRGHYNIPPYYGMFIRWVK